MPAVRSVYNKPLRPNNKPLNKTVKNSDDLKDINYATSKTVDLALLSKDQVYFPSTETERELFRTTDGKKLTAHQWAVYDLVRRIPCGRVTTYKHLCSMLREGSPRSVGSALRKNPFAPYVPCHRVIASDLSLGGFLGEWGTADKEGSQCARKVDMLVQEGVRFTEAGKLLEARRVVWK